ncbi:DUF444 family protein [bacterium]|nr:DUF444 family protein [bacterium]
MTPENHVPSARAYSRERWLELFQRGARDLLRHNEKIRDAVREEIKRMPIEKNASSPHGTLRVPVHFMEHYRFKLLKEAERVGTGQGEGKPGDQLRPATKRQGKGEGGGEKGGITVEMEFSIDDLIDWLWEELKLPNLKQKQGKVTKDEYTREGWSRRGVRSRLDRRRTVKEAIKRRSVQKDGPAFTNDDLRFRELQVRKRPSTQAVVILAIDVSSSMSDEERALAKTFIYWTIQGLRRQYAHLEIVLIAHTVEAIEFPEDQFFSITADGGTKASSAFILANTIIEDRFNPAIFNIYFFYASDGDNFQDDRKDAAESLEKLARTANFSGYLQTSDSGNKKLDLNVRSETATLFERLKNQGIPSACYGIGSQEAVFEAIRAFFTHQEEIED